jgi:hypothetical protein
MKIKKALHVSGGKPNGIEVRAEEPVRQRASKSSERPAPFPAGSVGANFAKRNYVKYLVERYHRCREAEDRLEPISRLQYSEIFQKIESKFKSPTYFIPEGRFAELVDFLHDRIENTVLGRLNGNQGIANYKSFEEYVMQHAEKVVNA